MFILVCIIRYKFFGYLLLGNSKLLPLVCYVDGHALHGRFGISGYISFAILSDIQIYFCV